MSISNEAVKAMILETLNDADVTVSGDGYKYETTVISPVFANLGKVKRHQMLITRLLTVNYKMTQIWRETGGCYCFGRFRFVG